MLAGILVIIVLAVVNVRGVEESIGINLILAVIDFCTQILIVLVGLALVFSLHTLVNNVVLGVRRPGDLRRDPALHARLHRIETISNMSEEAKNPARRSRRRSTGS